MFDNKFNYLGGRKFSFVLHNTKEDLAREGQSVFQAEELCK